MLLSFVSYAMIWCHEIVKTPHAAHDNEAVVARRKLELLGMFEFIYDSFGKFGRSAFAHRLDIVAFASRADFRYISTNNIKVINICQTIQLTTHTPRSTSFRGVPEGLRGAWGTRIALNVDNTEQGMPMSSILLDMDVTRGATV